MAPINVDADQPGMEDAQALLKKAILGKKLRKTSMCSFFPLGKCKYGSACGFAHDVRELVAPPDLRKTRLCEAFMAGRCTEQDCKFAHGTAELRKKASIDSQKSSPSVLIAQGMCTHGSRFGFSHDSSDLSPESPPGLDCMPLAGEAACAAELVSDPHRSWLSSTNVNASACAAFQAGTGPARAARAPPGLPSPAAARDPPGLRTKLSSKAAMFTPSVLKPIKVDTSSISATTNQDLTTEQCIAEPASISNQLERVKLRVDLNASSEDSPREGSTSAGSSDAGAESLATPMRVGEVLGCM